MVANGAGVGDGAQRQHAAERPAFDGEHARPRAGGEDRVIERDGSAAGQSRLALCKIKRLDALAHHQLDVGAAIKCLGAQDLRPGFRILDECLGQRRLVIGQFGFVADQRDPAVEAFLAQTGRRLDAGVSRSDDDDAILHACPFFPAIWYHFSRTGDVLAAARDAPSGSHPERPDVKRPGCNRGFRKT